MAITSISNAFLDNVGLAQAAAMFRQTSVGIGDFDGFAEDEAALPTAATGNSGKVYFVGDNATPYTSDGTDWTPGTAIDVVVGASFHVVDTTGGGEPNIVLIGVFTAKPVSGAGGTVKLYELGGDRALTSGEIDDALTNAGF
jgi:hypothetical protein